MASSSTETTTSIQQNNPEQISNSKMIQPTVQDDETDSCFEFIKRRNLAVKSIVFPNIKSIESPAPTPEDDLKKIIKAEESESSAAPKVVVVKPIAQFSSKVSPIKPVKSSPFKQSCIDKIAENLKALQEQKKTAIIPKVTPTVAVINKDALIEDKLKSIKLSPKEIAHQLILLRCKKIDNAKRQEISTARTSLTSVENQKNQTKMDEYEMNDDLTNLNWLTTFNLCKNVNGMSHKYPLSLSPPATPSSPISPLSTFNNSSIEDDTTLEHDEDEGDSNHLAVQPINKNSAVWPVISKLLKNWQQQQSPSSSSPKPDQKKENIPGVLKPDQTAAQVRPPYSYSCLTFLAIESSQRKRLSVKEIYSWVISHFPYYRSVPSGSWKNSIRHNLSLNQSFCKVDKNLLAMRDFSGKGSLWCINPETRPKLIEALERTRTNDLNHLLHVPYLQDISESVKPVSVNTNPVQKLTKNRSASTLNAAPMTIINPRLTQKLNFNAQTSPNKQTLGKQSLKSLAKQAPVVVSPAVLKTHKKLQQQQPNSSDLTELDAVNALLSMKSRASSMPNQTESDENKATVEAKQGRRKQVFKPPIKKPHINPKLLDKCASSALFYNDIEDEDEEDFEDENEDDAEMNLSQESDFEPLIEESANSKKKLQIKFPNFMPKQHPNANNNNSEINANQHIVTMSDDESVSDDMEENKLEIDETFSEQRDQFKKEEENIITAGVNVSQQASNEDSNESNLEPGEVPKTVKPESKSTSDDRNLFLELPRAATVIEVDATSTTKIDDENKPISMPTEESTTPSKAKRAKLTNETTPTRATRSSSGQGSASKVDVELPERTVTRSASKRKSK